LEGCGGAISCINIKNKYGDFQQYDLLFLPPAAAKAPVFYYFFAAGRQKKACINAGVH
jgi:hypothetical protein